MQVQACIDRSILKTCISAIRRGEGFDVVKEMLHTLANATGGTDEAFQ